MIALVLLAICASSGTLAKQCRCELIEFNTVEREECQPCKQVIFWEWDAYHSRYNVRSWVLAEKVEQIDGTHVRVAGWIVEGKIRHTITGYDPERDNANLFPSDKRNFMPWEKRGVVPVCP